MLPIKITASLPQKAYSATQVLSNEALVARQNNISMLELMETAGAAVFAHIKAHYKSCQSILVICGKGNNGGDGFVIARLAQQFGIKVTVYLAANSTKLQGDALTKFRQLEQKNTTIIQKHEHALTTDFLTENNFTLIIDALFGIGFKGELPKDLQSIVKVVNANKLVSKVISVDVPSGLNATTGHVCTDAIIADETISLIVVKQGLLTGQAANYVGVFYLAELGLGTSFQSALVSNIQWQNASQLPNNPQRKQTAHKGNIGLLLALGGNVGMPGAIRLASEAALRTGASLVAVCCHENNQALVFNGRPELMLTTDNLESLVLGGHFEKAKVLLLGPGLGKDSWAKEHFDLFIKSNKASVVDADALNLLSEKQQYRNNWVLTPHPSEAAKLLKCSVADIEQDRFTAVTQIAQKYGGVCVLKGAGSLISDGQTTWINTSGNAGMASGGMGDVLSGIIAALLLQLPDPLSAVRLAVYIHGKAADEVAKKHGMIGMLASDLFAEIQQLINVPE